jgi:hypothetical protein
MWLVKRWIRMYERAVVEGERAKQLELLAEVVAAACEAHARCAMAELDNAAYAAHLLLDMAEASCVGSERAQYIEGARQLRAQLDVLCGRSLSALEGERRRMLTG